MTEDRNLISVVTECLQEAHKVHLALLEDGVNTTAMKESGRYVRSLISAIETLAYSDDGSPDDDNDDDPDEMENFYSEEAET